MTLPIVVISASCQLVSFVMLLVMFSADSDNRGAIESVNWAEIANAKLSSHLPWCRPFFGLSACLGMQMDLHIGGVYTAGYFRVHSSSARDFISFHNTSSFNQLCMIPDGPEVCAGCQHASDTIITFQTFSLAAHLIAAVMCYNQVKRGATMFDRSVLVGTGTALFFFGIIMVSTFHDQCFTQIPASLEPIEGSCYVFASFQIVLAVVGAALQLSLGYQEAPLSRGSLAGSIKPSGGDRRLSFGAHPTKAMTPLVPLEDREAKPPPPFMPLSPNGRRLSGSKPKGPGKGVPIPPGPANAMGRKPSIGRRPSMEKAPAPKGTASPFGGPAGAGSGKVAPAPKAFPTFGGPPGPGGGGQTRPAGKVPVRSMIKPPGMPKPSPRRGSTDTDAFDQLGANIMRSL